MIIPFVKMHGAGNDFVLVDALDGSIEDVDWSRLATKICDRHFGVGSDGVILVLPSAIADYRMRMFNPDGSEAQMCGNGMRCFARYVYDRYRKALSNSVETKAGIMVVELTVDDGGVKAVRVNMGVPTFETARIPTLISLPVAHDYPLKIGGRTYLVSCVGMGNPHTIMFLGEDELCSLDVSAVGPLFECHPLFPERTNVEFCSVADQHTVRMRVWERGAGETLACGTGACASAVSAIRHGLVRAPVNMLLDGGRLTIEWAGSDEPVFMSGSAQYVFEGAYPYEALT